MTGQNAHELAFMRQSTLAAAPLAQLLLGSPKRPNDPPVEQPDTAYSSGAPKMCPVSWMKTRSKLSMPQPSLRGSMTTRLPLA